MTMIEQLRARKRPRTFIPFVIVVKDGRRFPVQFAFNEYEVLVIVEGDHAERFEPSDITGFEELHPVS